MNIVMPSKAAAFAASQREQAEKLRAQHGIKAQSWYRITNAADSDEAEVMLYDEIGGWFGATADQFIADLRGITAPNLRVRINSPGGSVFEGIAIANALRSHPANVTVQVDDGSVGGSPDASAAFALSITDTNEAPTAVSFTNVVASLGEDSSTALPTRVADIVVADDALGTNALSLTGPDAALFEITGNALYLKAGVSLDYETVSALNVTVQVAPPGSDVTV